MDSLNSIWNFLTLVNIEQLTGIVSHIVIIGLFFQFWQVVHTNRTAFKNNFIACTSRYSKIQELLLSDDDLNGLYESIYEKKKRRGKPGIQASRKERALCGIMFQLMEDVWMIHDFAANKKWFFSPLTKWLSKKGIFVGLKRFVKRKIFVKWRLFKEKEIFSEWRRRFEKKDVFDGWHALFKDWMRAPIMLANWDKLKYHYSRKFREFVEEKYVAS